MENRNKVISTVGIVVGIIMIIIGFSIRNPETYDLAGRNSLGGLITFGGDFYTEIYAVTFRAAQAVQRAYVNICNAISWLIIAMGGFDVCYFVSKFFDADDNYMPSYRSSTPSQRSATPVTSVIVPEPPVKAASVTDEKWICGNCQAENSSNYGQCKKCGRFRG